MSRTNTCRFCQITIWDGDGAVKYGVRHYAHFRCYLHAGKALDDIPTWKVGEFPHRLLKEYGLLDHPKIKEVRALIAAEVADDLNSTGEN